MLAAMRSLSFASLAALTVLPVSAALTGPLAASVGALGLSNAGSSPWLGCPALSSTPRILARRRMNDPPSSSCLDAGDFSWCLAPVACTAAAKSIRLNRRSSSLDSRRASRAATRSPSARGGTGNEEDEEGAAAAAAAASGESCGGASELREEVFWG